MGDWPLRTVICAAGLRPDSDYRLHPRVRQKEKASYSVNCRRNYYYDGDNNVGVKVLRDGTAVHMTYDSANRMTTGGDGATYAYDNLGQLRTASYGGRTLSFTYDALGRMTSQTSNLGTLLYAYDAAGDRTGMTWPDGFALTFKYNANPTLQSFWEGTSASGGYTPMSFYYDNQNRLNGMSWLSGVNAATSYDPVSRISSATLNVPNAKGTTFNLNYNEASQAKTITNSNGLYDWPTPTNFSHAYGLN